MRSKPQRDEGYVEDALKLCDTVAEYLQHAPSLADFEQNQMLKDAIMLQLIYLGEACSKISEARQEQNPEIEWHRIKGMRNRLAHDYWQENAAVVYETAQKAVPKLRVQLLAFRF